MCLEFRIRCCLIGIGCPEELQFSESPVYARLKVKAEPMAKSGKRCAFDRVVSLRNVPQLRPHQCGEFGFVNTPRNVYTWCDKSEVGTYIQASNDEVERRGIEPVPNEADLSRSSTPSLAH
jgi:hypothetical protein